MRKCYLLLFLILSLSIQSFAGKISGRVTDGSNNEPLFGVVVVIKELNKGVQTDEDGRFEFNDIEKGTYEIVSSLVSYKKSLQTVTLLNKDIELNISLKPEGNTLKDVTVKANRTTNTENAVMMEIKKSNLVVSGVSASQIAKTMDRNAADVVKRVPGVSIRDDKFIMVRGLYDRYNTVWLNDAGTPSSEVDKKSFSFDLIPSGLIDRILVFKTPAPELPGDFAGGMVKVYTTSLPDRNQITASYQVSHLQGSTGTNFNYEEPSKTDKWGYDDGRRQLPEGIPNPIADTSDVSAITKKFPNDWIIKTRKLGPDGRLNLAASGLLKIKNVRIGNTFGASYSKTSTNYVITRQSWDSTAQQDYYHDLKSVSNVNIALMNNTAVAFGNSRIEFKNLYNQGGRAFIVERTSVRDTVNQATPLPDEKAYALSYESRAAYTAQLTGTHKTSNDNTKYNWTLGYSDLFKDQPSLRRIKYAKQQDMDDSMYQAGVAGGVPDPINGGGRFYSQLFEHIYSFNHQLTQTIKIKGYSFDVSLGNYYEYKSRFSWARSLGYTIKPGASALTLKRYSLDRIFSDSTVGESDNFNIGENVEKSNTYTAQNKLIASFIALKLPIGDKISIYGGVRNEHNTQSIQTFSGTDSISPEIVTKHWLPSVNATYNFTDKSLVRVAYGKTLNRPEFREWAPFYFYDFEARAGTRGALAESVIHENGDTIKVAEIQNYDLRWEWYPASGEMIHAGIFYKSFKNPIQRIVLAGGVDSKAFTFANAESAYSAGIEVEARKNFMFLDDWFKTNIFQHFTFVGNAAFIKSEQTINFDTTNQIKNAPLLGQSPYMYNAGLFYQNDSLGLQGSIQYNVFGPRLFAVGTTDDESIGDLPFHSLDFVISKYFFKHYMVNVGIQNILDQTVTQVEDVNRDDKFQKGDIDKTWSSYKPGRYFTVGVKIKF